MENIDLLLLIVEEHISKNASEIINIIISNPSIIYGKIYEKVKDKMTKDNYEMALCLLIKNQFIYIENNDNMIKDSLYFGFNANNILNVLSYPKYLYFLTLNYGAEAADIGEKFFQFGVMTVKSLIKKYTNINIDNTFLSKLKILFDEEIIIKKDNFYKIETSISKMKLEHRNSNVIEELKNNSLYVCKSNLHFNIIAFSMIKTIQNFYIFL